MTGTTTTGSIDGKLKLDIGDFLAKIELVKQEARKLGSEHPTIDVDANTGKAQAAMAAVDAAAQAMGQSAVTAGERVKKSANDVSAAQARVAAANQAADVAYERARIAQMRLTEAQETGRSKASTLAAAELALSEAMGRLDKANARATASEIALEQAQQEAANAALKQAAAEEVAAKANDRVADSAGRANARTQLIIAAVVALTALAAPLTGALVGVAGGLAGIGAAGVLGIIGAVQAVKQGTQAGQEWSAGLKTLKADMSALAGTAASGLLSSFQRSVSLINADMPQLNSEVAGFARILGSTAVSALQGAITAMHILNPLFMQGAGVVQSMADGFSSWASNGGLQKFADYAQSVLPQVITTVGDLAAAILHIAEATAPLGAAVLGVLDGVANAINAIPTPALTVLAGAVITAWTAFMLFKGVNAVINGVKTAAEALNVTMRGMAFAGGAVGIALTALAVVFTAVAQANAEADARAKSYADTLDSVTGKATQKTREWAAEQLSMTRNNFWQGQSLSALDAGQKIGLSVDTITSAYMGNESAAKKVNAAIEKYTSLSGKARDENGSLVGAANILRDVMNEGAAAAEGGAHQQQQYADALAATTAGNESTALTTEAATEAFWKEASAAEDAVSKLGGMVDALNLLNGVNQSAEQANARWHEQLDGIAQDAQKQADAYAAANGSLDGFALSLDFATTAGAKNRAMLSGVAAAAEESAKSTYIADTRTMSASAATDKYAASLQSQKQAFIDSAVNAGYNAEEVQKLADKVLQIPPKWALEFMSNAGEVTDETMNLAKQIQSTPNGRFEISSNDLPALAGALASLGVDITTLPEGSVRVRNDDGSFSTVEEALNTIVRARTAPVNATADTAAAEGALNNTARLRSGGITATASTDDAEAQLNHTARDRTATIALSVVTVGNQYAYSGGKYSGAYGGTASSSGFKGLAGGGTIGGNGSAWSDTAGLYRLANSEEVISNTVGQAGRWRSLLKAINRNDPAGAVAARASQIAGVQPAVSAPVVVPAPIVRVFIGNEEITGHVQVVVDDAISQQSRSARNGRGR